MIYNINANTIHNNTNLKLNKKMNLNWQREQQKTPYPGQQKQGYTLTYIDQLHSLLLFGGSSATRNNEIYLYNLLNKQWKLQKVSTPKPIARKYHTAYYQRDLKGLIVYGGQAEKRRSLDCFYILFVEEWKWRKLLFKVNVPPAREFHTFTPISNGNYIIFGGIMLPYQTYLQDVWVLKGVDKLKDTKTMEIAGCSCMEIVGKGMPPSGRYAHNAYYHRQTLHIIGGQSQTPEQTLTIHSLSLPTLQWSRHTFNINLPQLINPSLLPHPTTKHELFLLGGLKLQSNPKSSQKENKAVYLLSSEESVPKIRRTGDLPENVFVDVCCALPYNQVVGICCSVYGNKLVLYRMQIPQEQQELELEQYLRYIKNQQFLSQELLHKVTNLEQLYKEIQSYISKLYKQYQQSGDYDEEIEREKKIQIEACLGLKEKYGEIQEIAGKNLVELRIARKELAGLNQYFQGYIETERDEDQ